VHASRTDQLLYSSLRIEDSLRNSKVEEEDRMATPVMGQQQQQSRKKTATNESSNS